MDDAHGMRARQGGTWIRRLDSPGPGVRLAVKDCIDVEGVPTTVGCPVIAERARPAVADAAVALGTDTGGSVRIPAACCGVVGLKTTWGRVPAEGVYPLAPSMDTVGPLGADVAAVELAMRLIEPGFAAGPCDLAVGRLRPQTDPPVDPAVDAAVDAALAAAGVMTTDLPGFDVAAAVDAANVLIDAEAYQVNEYLLPDLARLSLYNQRTMTEAAAITAARRPTRPRDPASVTCGETWPQTAKLDGDRSL
jgi:Asp-tRNA(Asn)/Glu-tRNA(Gln) amidotransferase A subunit family amidase